jgi:regulator of protease activity HflC (stomatin/prohibitin superfamily)
MKKVLLFAVIALVSLSTVGCYQTVPAGNVGVKVYMLGTNKGVDNSVLGVGRYWIGINEELYTYPTYQINYVFTKDATEGSPANEEFVFQTVEGMECAMDLGVSAHFDQSLVAKMFQTYRKGPDEIREVVIRNAIRDALNKVSSTMPVESVYGSGKAIMIDSVQTIVKKQLAETGIMIDKISLIGSLRLPEQVKNALDAKVTATQKAQQKQNELMQAEADAKKMVADAQGIAESNKIKASSLTTQNLEWERLQIERMKVEKWNGALPQTILGGATPMINISK